MYVTPRIIPFLFSMLTNNGQYLAPQVMGDQISWSPFGLGAEILKQAKVRTELCFNMPSLETGCMARPTTPSLTRLPYGANPNPYVYDGMEAPLVRAAEYCNYETIAMLIAAGADPGIFLTSGETIQTILERMFVPDRRKKRWLLNAALDKRRQAEKTQTAPHEAADEAGPDER